MGTEKRTDAELVRQVRSGDRHAFDALVTRYLEIARRVAIGMVANEEVARDLVQEALLQAYLSLRHLREAERFRSWLYGIVLNVCRGYLRDPRNGHLSLERVPAQRAEAGGSRFEALLLSQEAPDPWDSVAERELHRAVLEAVQALPPRDREATLLFYYEQCSLREVAALSGDSVLAVKDRLYRARKKLRERLLPAYPEMERPARRERRSTGMVKAKIEGVYERRNGGLVALTDEAESRALPIWIGRIEALAIEMGLKSQTSPRPLTFDLMLRALEALGGKIEEVRVEAIRENTYYAVLKLRRGKQVHELDARPSDALALAVRKGSPIYIAEAVLEEAQIDPDMIRHFREPDYEPMGPLRFTEVAEVVPRLTAHAHAALLAAQDQVRSRGATKIGTEHLLLALIQEPENGGVRLLERIGISIDTVQAEIERLLKPRQEPYEPVAEVEYDRGTLRAIDLAWEESEALGHDRIGTEHLLLGLVREGHCRGGVILRKLGADLERVRAEAGTLHRDETAPAEQTERSP